MWFLGLYPVPDGTSPWYQLWSGIIPALTVLTLLGTVAGAWHHLNCHEPKCLRIGKHKVDGSPWCNRHHERARAKAAATLDDVVARLDKLLALLERGGRE